MKRWTIFLLAFVLTVTGLAPVVMIARGRSSCVPAMNADASDQIHLDADQLANALTVAGVAGAMGMGDQAVVVGLMTALTESSLRNLDHGDPAGPDSRGIFQQRAPWGAMETRLNVSGASQLFFEALAAVPDWRNKPPWLAAQEVQRSAFDDGQNYAANYDLAVGLSSAIRSGSLVGRCSIGGDTDGGFEPQALPGASRAVTRALGLVGQHGYFQLCARLAANIWGRSRAGYASAADQWSAMVAARQAHSDRHPPVGALMFWSTSGSYGHVAVYVGGGQVVSNDIGDVPPVQGGVYLVDALEIETTWHANYLGWAPPIYSSR